MTGLKYLISALPILLSLSVNAQNPVTVINLKCDSRINPIGIAIQNPHLSWEIQTSERDIHQVSFHILVSDSPEKLQNNNGNIWDSKPVKSDQSVQVEYAGTPLSAERKYYWKVKIVSQSRKESPWSEPATWQMGLLTAKDWDKAQWISYENLPESMRVVPGVHGDGKELGNKAVKRSVIPQFRKEFKVEKQIRNATLYICGLGQYEASINGQKIGKSFLAPGWTNYDKVCLYNTYDVTGFLKPGKNAIGVIVGNGFYNINRERYRKLVIAYGYPKMIGKLKIDYTDDSSATIISGTDWKCDLSPVQFSSIYGGEDYDARMEQKGWNSAGFNDIKWKYAITASGPSGELAAETDNPVTVRENIAVKKTEQPAPGKYLYDFGQNCSGIIELKVTGKRGSVIKLTPGELITKDKAINQKASGTPYFYTYTLKGEGVEIWRPRFSYYGFRYLMVEGAAPTSEKPGKYKPQIIDLQMLHTCNSAIKTGEFTCSDQLFNQIYIYPDRLGNSEQHSKCSHRLSSSRKAWLARANLPDGCIDVLQLQCISPIPESNPRYDCFTDRRWISARHRARICPVPGRFPRFSRMGKCRSNPTLDALAMERRSLNCQGGFANDEKICCLPWNKGRGTYSFIWLG